MKFLFFVLFFFIKNFAFGQPFSLIGYVKDNVGKPIASATILSSKKKYVLSITSANGDFKVYENCNDDTLICSHVNYESQYIYIKGNNLVNFFLQKKSPVIQKIKIGIKEENNCKQQTVNVPDASYGDDHFTKIEIPSIIPEAILNKFETSIKYSYATLHSIDSLKNICGNIKVGVSIGKNGKVMSKVVLLGIHKTYDDMVLEAIDTILFWIPAEQNGRKVESYQEVEVNL